MTPRNDDDRDVLHELMESLGTASEVLFGIDDKLRWAEALRKYLLKQEDRWGRWRRRMHRLLAGLSVGFVAALVALSFVQRQASTAAQDAAKAAVVARATAATNRRTIRDQRRSLLVGCTLLSQAIVDSTGQGPARTPAIRDARERQALFLRILARGASRAELARLEVLSARIAKSGGAIPRPPCREVVEHPERFAAIVP